MLQLCSCEACLKCDFRSCKNQEVEAEKLHVDGNFEEEEELGDSLRRNLVALDKIVAVRSTENALEPYWLYKVTELMDTSFKGLWLQPVRGNRLLLKVSKRTEEVDYRCVFSPDVTLGSKKAHKTVTPAIDSELCHFSC